MKHLSLLTASIFLMGALCFGAYYEVHAIEYLSNGTTKDVVLHMPKADYGSLKITDRYFSDGVNREL